MHLSPGAHRLVLRSRSNGPYAQHAASHRTRRQLLLEPLEVRLLLSTDLLQNLFCSSFARASSPPSDDPPAVEQTPLRPGETSPDIIALLERLPVDTSAYDASSIIVHVDTTVDGLSLLSSSLPGSRVSRGLQLLPGLYKVELPNHLSVESSLAQLSSLEHVIDVRPNYSLSLSGTVYPNDTSFSSLWGMHNTGQWGGLPDADIDAPEAWNITTGNSSTIVAVIDTGIDYSHPDLASNIWTNPGEIAGDGIDNDGNGFVDDVHGWDFYNWDNDPMDDHGHGTHVAGTIAAEGDDGAGVAGVAWNVQLMPLKMMGANGEGYSYDAIRALDYAIAMGATISNHSYGMYGMSDALAAALDADHLCVAAAGNDGIDTDLTPHYPSSFNLDNIISVAATDWYDNRASWSNYGATSVDLGAPGAYIYSTLPDGRYGYMSGTSMAAPHVTGAAALVRSLRPDWSAIEIKNAILNSIDPLASLQGVTVTGGRLNAYQAAMAAVNFQPASANLIAHWAFDDDDGSVARDTSPFGADHTAALVGNAQWTGLGAGGALRLDGIDAGASVPSSGDLNLQTVTQRTVSLWFTVDDSAVEGRKQVLFEEGGLARGLSIYVDAGQLYVGGWNTAVTESGWAGTFLSTAAIQPGQWHHVALVLEGGASVTQDALRAYLDGVQFGSGEGSQLWLHGDPTGVGQVAQGTRFHDALASSGGHGLSGMLDEVRVYNRVLKGTEIEALADQNLTSADALLVELDVTTCWEQGGSFQGTLTRLGDLSTAVTVTLTSSDPSELTVPDSVVIAAGSAQTRFSLTPQDDTDDDGVQSVTITASSSEYVEGSATLQVLDNEPSQEQLVAYWSMNEGSGSVVGDTAPYGQDHTGSLQDDTAWVARGLDHALRFDGQGDAVAVPNTADLNLNTITQRTISLWFAVDDSAVDGRKQVLFEEGGLSRGLSIYVDAGRLYVGGWNTAVTESGWAGTFLSTAAIQPGQWHHVALVLEGGASVTQDALRAYLDGVQFGSGDGSQLWMHGDPTGVGQVAQGTRFHDALASSGGHGLSGMLDEVRIYNRALDSTEIEVLAGQNLTSADALLVELDVTTCWEQGGSVQGTVTRLGDVSTAVTVTLTSSDTSELTVPGSVVIAAGSAQANFTLTPRDDADNDGGQWVTITASASQYVEGTATLQVLDNEPSQEQLVAYWSMNEGSGSVVGDTAPYGQDHTGSLQGDTTWVAMGLDHALRFDGQGDAVAVPNTTDLNLNTITQRTVALWFTVDDNSVDGRKQVLFEEGGLSRGLSIYVDAGRLYVGGWNTAVTESGWAGTFLSTAAIQPGQWHHVALVLEGGASVTQDALRGYLDGVQFGSGEGSQLWLHGDPTGLGQVAQGTRFHDALASSGGYGLSGMLDEVRVYNLALDSTEIEVLAGQNLVMETLSQGMLAEQIVSLPGDTHPATTAVERSLDAVETVMEESLRLWSACDDGPAFEQAIADLEAGIRDLTSGFSSLSLNDDHFMGDYVTGSPWLPEATPPPLSDPLESAEEIWTAVGESLAGDRLDLLTLLARELCAD